MHSRDCRSSPMVTCGSSKGDATAPAGKFSSSQTRTVEVLSGVGVLVQSKGDMLLYGHHRRNSPMLMTRAGRVVDKLGRPKLS